MKIESDVLKEKLKYINFGISKNNTDAYRHRAIRFSTVNDTVYAYSFDAINNVKVEIGTTDKDFSATIDYATFANFIKSCEGEITLSTSAKSMNVQTSVLKAKLPIYPSHSKNNGIPEPVLINCDKELNNNFRLDLIKLILDENHPVDAYQKVYFGDKMMVSDTDNVLILDDKLFDTDIMLSYSSIELLNNLTDAKYSIKKDDKLSILYVTANELDAKIIISNNINGEYQYEDLLNLFSDCNGSSIDIDTKTLSKAMSTSQLFKSVPDLIFSNNGVFLNIDTADFSYRISNVSCEDKKITLEPKIAKRICSIGDTVTLYYKCEEESLLKVEHANISEILSWR